MIHYATELNAIIVCDGYGTIIEIEEIANFYAKGWYFDKSNICKAW